MRILRRISMLLFGAAVIVLAFTINLRAQLSEFENTAQSKKASVNEYIEVSGSFIDMMTIYGSNYLSRNPKMDSSLYGYIQYDTARNGYHMDAIRATEHQNAAGNLTGSGAIPQSGRVKTEVCLALDYGKYFSGFYKRVPEVAWLYYTSENSFIYMYPWVSSGDFTYSDSLMKKEFYTVASPENNPMHTPVWTPVYLDAAGKGLMVTLSSPIYCNEAFAGVVSLDLTTEKLGEIISSEYRSYLVDVRNSVIAASPNVKLGRKEIQFSVSSGLSRSGIEQLERQAASKAVCVEGCYIYASAILNTPWRLYTLVPVWSVIGLSLLYTSPILAVSLLMFWTLLEVEKRRRTEVRLNNSLAEIKSYHDLLENSAKHDFLTDTCNRRGLREDFERLLSSSDDIVPPISFMIGDIDEFKIFNDTYGHTAGDRVLVEIAGIMKRSVGEKDIVCRWGGEEFVLMLYQTTYEDALALAEKIRLEIEANAIPWPEAGQLHATMTFGVAAYGDGDDVQSAVSKADSALYLGKKRGRNCVAGWEETQGAFGG